MKPQKPRCYSCETIVKPPLNFITIGIDAEWNVKGNIEKILRSFGPIYYCDECITRLQKEKETDKEFRLQIYPFK